MSQVRSEVRSAFSVVADGLRLAGRHLPVLLTLHLFGPGCTAPSSGRLSR